MRMTMMSRNHFQRVFRHGRFHLRRRHQSRRHRSRRLGVQI
jgi:hypothetical protein